MNNLLKKYGCRIVENEKNTWYNSKDVGIILGLKNIRKNLNSINSKEKIKLKTNELSFYNIINFEGDLNNRGELFISENAIKIIASNSRNIQADKFCFECGIRKDENKLLCKQTIFEKQLIEYINIYKEGFKKGNLDDINLYSEIDKMYEFEKEYSINGYRVDFYFKYSDIIIEYDEHNHKFTTDKDVQREKNINNYLKEIRMEEGYFGEEDKYYIPTWIRVDEGNEIQSIIKILGAIQGKIIF